jgi:hypothetical protein
MASNRASSRASGESESPDNSDRVVWCSAGSTRQQVLDPVVTYISAAGTILDAKILEI